MDYDLVDHELRLFVLDDEGISIIPCAQAQEGNDWNLWPWLEGTARASFQVYDSHGQDYCSLRKVQSRT